MSFINHADLVSRFLKLLRNSINSVPKGEWMNVPELFENLSLIRKSYEDLHLLVVDSVDISLKADSRGKLSIFRRPSAGNARTTLAYQDLWSDVTNGMFHNILQELDKLRQELNFGLQRVSRLTQQDILKDYEPDGTLSFWRLGDIWLTPLIHNHAWENRYKVYFVDSFETYEGTHCSYLCHSELGKMPVDYQFDFIKWYWDVFEPQGLRLAGYSNNPPPMVEQEISELSDRLNYRPGNMSGLLLAH